MKSSNSETPPLGARELTPDDFSARMLPSEEARLFPERFAPPVGTAPDEHLPSGWYGEPEQAHALIAESKERTASLDGMLALRAALFAVLKLDVATPAPSTERFAAELLDELDRAGFRVVKK
jgi:hypothetical protein